MDLDLESEASLLAIDRFWTKVESRGCGEATEVRWRIPGPKRRQEHLLLNDLNACHQRSFALLLSQPTTAVWDDFRR
jgi:hypothetical protein